MKKIIGQITKSNDPYMPKHEDCEIWLTEKGKVYSAHRLSNGGGTYANKFDDIEFKEQQHEVEV